MKRVLFLVCILMGMVGSAQVNDKLPAANVFKIGNYTVTMKNSFEFYSVDKQSNDTLLIEICSNNMFAPFGVFKDTNAIKQSQLKNYRMRNRIGTGEDAHLVQTTLTSDTNNLEYYFFSNAETAAHSYIIRGNIFDPKLKIFNTIQLGVDKKTFYDTFFISYPQALESNFNYVILQTCVFGIQHIYRFEKNKLYSVRFRCPNCVGVKRIDKY